MGSEKLVVLERWPLFRGNIHRGSNVVTVYITDTEVGAGKTRRQSEGRRLHCWQMSCSFLLEVMFKVIDIRVKILT